MKTMLIIAAMALLQHEVSAQKQTKKKEAEIRTTTNTKSNVSSDTLRPINNSQNQTRVGAINTQRVTANDAVNSNYNTTGNESIGTGAQTGTLKSGTVASGDVKFPQTSTPGSTVTSQSTMIGSSAASTGVVVGSTSGATIVSSNSPVTTTPVQSGGAVNPNSNASGTVHNNGISASSTGVGTPAVLPPTIVSNFSSENRGAGNVNWRSERGNWVATYKTGNLSATSTYNADGTRLDTRTEIDLNGANAPKAVTVYLTQNVGVEIDKAIRIDKPGARETFELRRRDGLTVTINSDGQVQ